VKRRRRQKTSSKITHVQPNSFALPTLVARRRAFARYAENQPVASGIHSSRQPSKRHPPRPSDASAGLKRLRDKQNNTGDHEKNQVHQTRNATTRDLCVPSCFVGVAGSWLEELAELGFPRRVDIGRSLERTPLPRWTERRLEAITRRCVEQGEKKNPQPKKPKQKQKRKSLLLQKKK
jgi:hypothetical protein